MISRGLIPSPTESKEDYASRCRSSPSIAPLTTQTQPLFGFIVDWIPITYSNKNLPFWHGAVFSYNAGHSMLQLRASLKKKEKLFGLYDKEEILAHESVHAARVLFHDPKYEEIFAYMTSPSLLRRHIGPLFRYHWESALLLFTLLLSFLPLPLIFLLPWALIAFWSVRLCLARRSLCRCLAHLCRALNIANALPLAVCLSDAEIDQFAKWSSGQIAEFLEQKKATDWRWEYLLSFSI